MTKDVFTGRRNIQSRTKVKTGCTTCRIRKVKCDEAKPFCRKCVNTGRTCDGYGSLFRLCKSQDAEKLSTVGTWTDVDLQPVQTTSQEITAQAIDLLNHYFSIKTIFNVQLGCDQEAKQVLEASLTDPAVRHAISALRALRALRETIEASGGNFGVETQQSQSYNYGLQQYIRALEGVVSNLSCLGPSALKSALLCCLIFISIEQVQANFATMAEHIIRGLRIMHEYRARPCLNAANELLPAVYSQLPFLDVFIIKLFAAPCKFADPTSDAGPGVATPTNCPIPLRHLPAESSNFRTIAPNMRTQLTTIASPALEFLDEVSQLSSVENALRLLQVRTSLLVSLGSWIKELENLQKESASPQSESVSISFMRMFHAVLKIVLLGSLKTSPELDAELQIENDCLQSLANSVDRRLKAFATNTNGNGRHEDELKVH